MKIRARLPFFVVLLSSPITLLVHASAETRLLTGPYIPEVDRQSALVAFELSQPSPAKVILRDDDKQLTFASESAKTLHFVTIDGLNPGKTYEYSLSVPGVDLGERAHGRLRTANVKGESYSFAVIGDTRPGENQTTLHHRALVEQISLFEPAFYLHLGDMVDNGDDPADWHAFSEVQEDLLRHTAIFPTSGDNDYVAGTGLVARYFPRLDRGYYSFEWGGVHFFGLSAWDTRGKQPEAEYDSKSEQFRWLASELAKQETQDAPFRVVFLHDPVVISRGRSSSLLRGTYAPLFEAHRVDLVFSSWHLYERSRINGVNYVISGGGGAGLIWSPRDPEVTSLAEAKSYHYCRVDVSASGLSLRAIAEDGTVLDNVTLSTSTGGDTRNRAFSRFAGRMATRVVVGEPTAQPVPVYLFDTGNVSAQRVDGTRIRPEAHRRGLMYDIYMYDVRKKGVYDLLLQAAVESSSTVTGFPALFVGRKNVANPGDLSSEITTHGNKIAPTMFQKRLDLAQMRRRTAGATTSGAVMQAGILRSLNVWMILLLGILAERLLRVARRRGRVLALGSALIGGFFLLRVIYDVLYYDMVRTFPFIDATLEGAGAFRASTTYFAIQDMLAHSSYRSMGFQWLLLHGFALTVPAFLVVIAVKVLSGRRK